MKIRQNLYLDLAVSNTLEVLASRPGTSKSQIANAALSAYFANRAAGELDGMLRTRLDRISRDMGQSRRDLEVLLESLSLFIRYQLTVSAPLPEGDHAARAIGAKRFEAFVAQVGRQLAGGKRSIDSEARPSDGEIRR